MLNNSGLDECDITSESRNGPKQKAQTGGWKAGVVDGQLETALLKLSKPADSARRPKRRGDHPLQVL